MIDRQSVENKLRQQGIQEAVCPPITDDFEALPRGVLAAPV